MAANNHAMFIGNVVKDPEVSEVGQKKTPKATFKVGVNSTFGKDREKNEAVFPQFEAWGDTVTKVIEPYVKKGTQVVVHAEMKTDKWDDKATGEPRYRDYFRVTSIQLLGSKAPAEAGEDAPAKAKPAPAKGPKKPVKPEPDEFDVDDDGESEDDF